MSFPAVVNEKAARTVAAGVVVLAVTTLALGALDARAHWLVTVIAAGFWARVLTGPRLSLLGQLATRVIAPRLGEPVWTAGPPKRFAQALGTAITTGAVVALGLGAQTVAVALIGAVALAATAEAAFGFCVGCRIFALGIRLGLVPEAICVECADIRVRRAEPQSA